MTSFRALMRLMFLGAQVYFLSNGFRYAGVTRSALGGAKRCDFEGYRGRMA